MDANRYNDSEFDTMLARALKAHSEPIPSDFTARVLRQLESPDEKRLLARVVWQERLALAACVAVAVGVVIVAAGFPGVASGLLQRAVANAAQRGTDLLGGVSQGVEAFKVGSRFWLALVPVAVFALYALLDAAFGDRLSIV